MALGTAIAGKRKAGTINVILSDVMLDAPFGYVQLIYLRTTNLRVRA